MTEREKYVEELRCLADFYAGAPDDLPRPYINPDRYVEKDELPTVLAFCKPLEKSVWGRSVKLTKTLTFGHVAFLVSQAEVCERKVVGQHWVDPQPAKEGFFVDQVEWECKPILKSVEKGESEEDHFPLKPIPPSDDFPF